MRRALIGQRDLPARRQFCLGGALAQLLDQPLKPLDSPLLRGNDVRKLLAGAAQMGDALLKLLYVIHAAPFLGHCADSP